MRLTKTEPDASDAVSWTVNGWPAKKKKYKKNHKTRENQKAGKTGNENKQGDGEEMGKMENSAKKMVRSVENETEERKETGTGAGERQKRIPEEKEAVDK